MHILLICLIPPSAHRSQVLHCGLQQAKQQTYEALKLTVTMLALISLQYTPLLISLSGKLNNCILIFNFTYDLHCSQLNTVLKVMWLLHFHFQSLRGEVSRIGTAYRFYFEIFCFDCFYRLHMLYLCSNEGPFVFLDQTQQKLCWYAPFLLLPEVLPACSHSVSQRVMTNTQIFWRVMNF